MAGIDFSVGGCKVYLTLCTSRWGGKGRISKSRLRHPTFSASVQKPPLTAGIGWGGAVWAVAASLS